MLASRILETHLEPIPKSFSWLQFRRRSRRAKSWQLDAELTDFTAALSLLVRNGVPIHVALAWLGPRTRGKLGPILQGLNTELSLGAPLGDALKWFSAEVGGELASELAQKIDVSITRGTPLAEQLDQLATTASARHFHRLTQQAGSSETKMLVPTVFVVLPVTVLFAIYPSLSLLGNQI